MPLKPTLTVSGYRGVWGKTLTDEIAGIEANTSKTPVEVKALADKKVALDKVNKSLALQQESLKKQTNAWSAFAEGLKKTMVVILQELQKYIIQLMVVAAVKKAIGLAVSAFGGDVTAADVANTTANVNSGPALGASNYSGQLKVDPAFRANGGLIQALAGGGNVLNGIGGGFLPTNKGYAGGKDSVPIMGMPGEYMIKKSSVDFYGRDFFEKANTQKLAAGGLVGSSGKGAKGTEAPKQEFTLQIVNITPQDQVPTPAENAQQIINVINGDIARKGPTFRTIKAAVQG